MDIIWNEENFVEARRPPHTATSSEAIYLSACQLCNQQRLFNLDASENLCETDNSFHFHRLHCVLNLDEFCSSTTRSFKRNTWRAGSGDGHHMEWREFHGGSAAATHSDQLWSHLSQPMSACSNSAVAPLIWTARESDRGGVGCWISTLQWTSVTPAFNSGFHRFALGYDRSVSAMLFFANEAICPSWVLQSEVDWFRYRARAAFDTPPKPIYVSGESPVCKAPCCNGLKCTSNLNKHRNHFFPVALRMIVPQLQ